MKRLFTILPLVFSLLTSAAILLAYQQTVPMSQSDESATTATSPSLENEVKRLSEQLRFFEASIQDQERELVPPGTIAAYLGKIDKDNPPPKGWLLCDGQTTLDKLEYADLKKVIGTEQVPDLRGVFLRGLDLGRETDTKRVLGSLQGHAFQRHNHGGATGANGKHNHKPNYIDSDDSTPRSLLEYGLIRQYSGTKGGTPRGFDSSRNELDITKVYPIPEEGNHTHSIPEAGSGNETRPVNVAINYIIKY